MNQKSSFPGFSVKVLKYKLIQLAFQTIGRLSKGVQIGWKYGFDSGKSLDYVYENKANGIGFLGRMIDRQYLNSAGWRGIRIRGNNMQKIIRWAIDQHVDSKDRIEILDIASGPGRYVLEVLNQADCPKNLHARLCDLSEQGLATGQERARSLGIKNVDFEKRDAFAPDPNTGIKAPADVAIVSGLYELFSNNEMVLQSLKVLSANVREGGYLIYTNQPWHPQLEFIANVLINRDGEPWEMRCRSQKEMDELVNAAGFQKLRMLYDEQGIFTVSIATKRAFSESMPACSVAKNRELPADRNVA